MSSGAAPRRQPLEAALRDELVARAERDFAAADDLQAAADADPALADELDTRLADPATPLIAALAGWDGAPDEAQRLVALTSDNVERLAALVAASGWPGLTRVGPLGADAAWIIAQHADAANDLRRRLVDALRHALPAGEADPRHYAALVDRIAAVDRSAQTYGTIVLADEGRARFPVPVTDPAGLDDRRGAIGLPPVAEELPHLEAGELMAFGPERRRSPLLAWPTVLEGQASVVAALQAGVRAVHAVLAVRPGDRRLGRLRAAARQREVAIRAVEPAVIDELTSGATHGGVAAVVGRRQYVGLDELLAASAPAPLLALLEGIEDPHNFGQAIRALYAAGIDGLVVGPRSWESAAGIVARASAGTSELLPTARVGGPEAAAARCREAGLRVVCAAAEPDARPIGAVDLQAPTLLVIGGERRGIGRAFLQACDERVTIPYGRPDAPPLGAPAAAGIFAFEALRQRSAR